MEGLIRIASTTTLATVAIATILTIAMATITTNDESALRYVYANYSGDLLLAGFFPIHQSSEAPESNYCGRVQEEDGIQALEMFLYTLDEINKSGFLPNFTLGAVALDSCDDELYALQQVGNLIIPMLVYILYLLHSVGA